MTESIKTTMLQAPATQMDESIRAIIREWDDPPTALQVLKALDFCVHGGAASSFVVTALQIVLRSACARENTTLTALVAQASWRKGATP